MADEIDDAISRGLDLADSLPLSEQDTYIYFLAVANEALKRAGGDPFCLRPAPRAVYRACWYNAVYNREGTFRDAGLRLVFGSLRSSGVSIYGYKNPADRRYIKDPGNCHAWLEDAYGRIYDYIHAGCHLMVQLARKVPTFPIGEVRGATRAELAAQGLEYIPATGRARVAIVRNLLSEVRVLPPSILCGSRVLDGDEEPPVLTAEDTAGQERNAAKCDAVDASWRAGLQCDGLKACRAAMASNFVYELD